jgi:ATP-dependent helicase Lhr and Lhr-like helicase
MSKESKAFAQLHPGIQRWIWEKKWTELRDIQERATEAILRGEHDVLIAAGTASGKTEAAMLPGLSKVAVNPQASIQILYVSPLKALINDQFRRLDGLCEDLKIPVHKWHGDVSASLKKKIIKEPRGVLIITPESLEALFINRSQEIPKLFRFLALVVVDELHAFIGTERGRQLQSLLYRVELASRRRIPRVGLSATLGDLRLAADVLRPGGGAAVEVIEATAKGHEILLQLKGFLAPSRLARHGLSKEGAAEADESEIEPVSRVSEFLFSNFRQGHHLIFSNARSAVEGTTDRLRRACERERVPNPFHPHHGNLSREIREATEAALRDESKPATSISTSTLELGIDLGAVESVVQLGAAPTVSSLRQRMGRSGRRGSPSVLHVLIEEPEFGPDMPFCRRFRFELFEAVAQIELLLEGWCEPPTPGALHLSTLVQQLLSLVAQHGGVRPDQAFDVLCVGGPFRAVDAELFKALLRGIATRELVVQDHGGELILGARGETLVNHHTFYAAFSSPEELEIRTASQRLGTLPAVFPIYEGLFILFAGRRWRVVRVDLEHRSVLVAPAKGARMPLFLSAGGVVHDRVRQKMRELYLGGSLPTYLDSMAQNLFFEGRGSAGSEQLLDQSIVRADGVIYLFHWLGDRKGNGLQMALSSYGFEVCPSAGPYIEILAASSEDVRGGLAALAVRCPDEASLLARLDRAPVEEKHYQELPPDLQVLDYFRSHVDLGELATNLDRLAQC